MRPSLMASRHGPSDWNGMRKLSASASASSTSPAGPASAPASTRSVKGRPASCSARARCASARVTAWGTPGSVNPPMPRVAPCGISSAASSAVIVGNAPVAMCVTSEVAGGWPLPACGRSPRLQSAANPTSEPAGRRAGMHGHRAPRPGSARGVPNARTPSGGPGLPGMVVRRSATRGGDMAEKGGNAAAGTAGAIYGLGLIGALGTSSRRRRRAGTGLGRDPGDRLAGLPGLGAAGLPAALTARPAGGAGAVSRSRA